MKWNKKNKCKSKGTRPPNVKLGTLVAHLGHICWEQSPLWRDEDSLLLYAHEFPLSLHF